MGFGDLHAGDHMQVEGNQVSDSAILATKIIRTRASPAIVVAGKAWSAAAPFVSILDLTIGTGASTTYFDELGNAMAAADFFAAAAGHDVIVAAARAADGSLVATSMRLD
jgi:hypothetical protein